MGIKRFLNRFRKRDTKYVSDIQTTDFELQLCRATMPNRFMESNWLDNVLFRLDCDTSSHIFKEFETTLSYIDIDVFELTDTVSFVSLDTYHIAKIYDLLPKEDKSNPIMISLIDELDNYMENIEDSFSNTEKSFELIETAHPSWLRSVLEYSPSVDIDIYGYTWLDNRFRVKGISTRFYLQFEYIYLFIKHGADIQIPFGILIEDANGYIVKMTIQDFLYMYEKNCPNKLNDEYKHILFKIIKSEPSYFCHLIPYTDDDFESVDENDTSSFLEIRSDDENEEDTDFNKDEYYNNLVDEIIGK